jgi:hypothetical protein
MQVSFAEIFPNFVFCMAYLFEDLLKKNIGIYDNVFLEVIIDRQRAIIQGRVSVNQYFKM